MISVVAVAALCLAIGVALRNGRRQSDVAAKPQQRQSVDPIVPRRTDDTPAADSSIRFEQMSPDQTGVRFRYFGGPGPTHEMTEQNGGGIAAFDIDNDDLLDLFFVNGSRFNSSPEKSEATNRLYRGDGQFRFRDITHSSGVTALNFGQGCAVGDFDNDGFVDLFVATYGRNSLWKNNGDGTFDDMTEAAGIAESRFSSSAAWADLDGDGDLDLYVVNYLDWEPDGEPRDRISSPMMFAGQADDLYRNNGAGAFTQVGEEAGIALADDGKGLAVAIADLNDDTRLDIYVANDTRRNFLFLNQGELQFAEVGVPTGAAVSQDGSIGSSMGIAVADYNLDQQLDLLITNFAQEAVDVLMNMGEYGFAATNTELGMDVVSRPLLNFGIVCTDFDLDLWPDVFFANGHLYDDTAAGGMYRMPPALLQNLKGRRFADAADSGGDYFQQQWLGRATAMGDLDNDGDTDLVISHLDDPPGILKNISRHSGGSRRVSFVGTLSSRQPLGCAVRVKLTSDQVLALTIPSGGSFQVSHDPVLVVPTGEDGEIESITMRWSNGTAETWTNLPTDETIRLIEGRGNVAEHRD
jgi:enediyne biosynthesis protein E4